MPTDLGIVNSISLTVIPAWHGASDPFHLQGHSHYFEDLVKFLESTAALVEFAFFEGAVVGL